MALWQFSLVLIPKTWAEQNDYTADCLLDGEDYDAGCAWKGHSLSTELVDTISTVLPRTKSWSNSLILWGDTESNDIQLLKSEYDIEEITIRLDLRDGPDRQLNQKIIELAHSLNCVFFLPEQKKIMSADVDEFLKAIHASNAAKYMLDPRTYFADITDAEFAPSLKQGKILAFRIHPEPNGTRYSARDLDKEDIVLQLFDYCQVLEAYISKDGWDFLISKHGLEKLFELNRSSGWLDCDNLTEYETEIEWQKEHAPE